MATCWWSVSKMSSRRVTQLGRMKTGHSAKNEIESETIKQWIGIYTGMLHCSSISTMPFSEVSLEMVLTDSWMWVIFGKDSFFFLNSLQDQPLQHHQNAGLVLRQHQYFRDAGGMLGGWTVGANQDGWLSSSTSPLLFGATHQCRYLSARCQNLGSVVSTQKWVCLKIVIKKTELDCFSMFIYPRFL